MAITPATRCATETAGSAKRLLNGDVASIRELYLSNGFRDVKIDAARDRTGQGSDQTLRVSVTINEGEQWRVGEFSLEGVADDHLEAVRGLFSSHEGEPFSEASVALDRDQVLNYYYNRGYPNAQFDWDVEPLAGAKAVKIHVADRRGQAALRARRPGGRTEHIESRHGVRTAAAACGRSAFAVGDHREPTPPVRPRRLRACRRGRAKPRWRGAQQVPPVPVGRSAQVFAEPRRSARKSHASAAARISTPPPARPASARASASACRVRTSSATGTPCRCRRAFPTFSSAT